MAPDRRADEPRFGDNGERPIQPRPLKALAEITQAHRAKPTQPALDWVLSRGENVIPIPGMKRRTHLDENGAVADIRSGRAS